MSARDPNSNPSTEVTILRELLSSDSGYVSGNHLARLFGFSRVAIWMQLQKLTKQGFVFEAVRSRGYRLVQTPPQLHQALILAHLTGRGRTPNLITLDKVDSTNTEAERHLAAGSATPLVILAREQTQGRGGYMLIFDCDDPKARAERAQRLGVRLANHIDRERFQGYQLHPKDCRATFLEFDHSVDGEDAEGAYWPAGAHWQRHVRTDVTRRLAGVTVLSHDPAGLAAHWSAIMDVPAATAEGGRHLIRVDRQSIAFLGAPSRDDDPRAVARQFVRDALADPTSRTRHDGDFACQHLCLPHR